MPVAVSLLESWHLFARAQVHGSKHFLLSSPLAGNALEPFSSLHPNFRRAQVPPPLHKL